MVTTLDWGGGGQGGLKEGTFFFNGGPSSLWKFLGWGLNLSLNLVWVTAVAMLGPLTHYAGPRIEPVPVQLPEPLQSDSQPTSAQ